MHYFIFISARISPSLSPKRFLQGKRAKKRSFWIWSPMAKRRKSDAARLEEVDRTMYSTFSTAANSLSHLYSQAMNHQKLSFQAGERHAMEKLYQLILKQQEEGSRVTNVDVIAYLQHELDYGTEEPSMSPRPPFQQQSAQQPPTIQGQANPFAFASINMGARSLLGDPQTKNLFSNALSSPVRRNLQHYHLAQGGSHHPNVAVPGSGPRESSNRETDSPGINDSVMDMNADSPSHESSF